MSNDKTLQLLDIARNPASDREKRMAEEIIELKGIVAQHRKDIDDLARRLDGVAKGEGVSLKFT